jgi:hypothetical protein
MHHYPLGTEEWCRDGEQRDAGAGERPMRTSHKEGGAGGTSPRRKVFLWLFQPRASRTVRARTAAVKVEVPTGRTTLTACPAGTPAPARSPAWILPHGLPRALPHALLRWVGEGSTETPAASGLLRARSSGGSPANSADDPPASLRRCAALLDSRTRRVQRDRSAVWVLGPQAEEILGGTCNATQKARRETTMPGSPQGGWA